MSTLKTYQRLGIRWNTGHFDWQLAKESFLAILFVVLCAYAFEAAIAAGYDADRLQVVEKLLDLREKQIASCLTGGYVGSFWDKDTKQYVAVSCNPATEIAYGKEQ